MLVLGQEQVKLTKFICFTLEERGERREEREAMGSLMAGWSSSFEDPETVKFLRNKSLTREEIDAFWKSKENKDERETKNFVKINQENMMQQISGEKPQRSSSLPLMDRRASILNSISRADAVKNIKNSGWWTRSDSAFLNELPVTEMEGPSYKYASQYHITRFDKQSKEEQ